MKRFWEYFHSKLHRYLHSVYTQQKYLEWVKHTKGILLIELLIKKKKKKKTGKNSILRTNPDYIHHHHLTRLSLVTSDKC